MWVGYHAVLYTRPRGLTLPECPETQGHFERAARGRDVPANQNAPHRFARQLSPGGLSWSLSLISELPRVLQDGRPSEPVIRANFERPAELKRHFPVQTAGAPHESIPVLLKHVYS